MRKLILFFLCGTLGVLLSACASTGSTIYTYDSESWLAGISASTATAEDPTPTVKILVGRNDKGFINVLPQHDISVFKEIIPAIRAGDLSAGLTGVTATKQEGEK